MEWTFGTVLWSTAVFFFWFAVIWMFVTLFADILRRDMSGWAKAGWIVLIVLLPFLGILVYLIVMSRTGDREVAAWAPTGRPQSRRSRDHRPADEIAKAAELHERGRISADE